MNDALPLVPSIDQLSRIIGSVAAPAFLLGAVAAFISVLISRMNRVMDRSQFLHGIAEGDGAKEYLKADIPRLKSRAVLLNQSIFYSIVSAIITASLIRRVRERDAPSGARVRRCTSVYCRADILRPVAGQPRSRDANCPE
jgi:Protein of unknown function (DUF2721)